MVSSSTRPPGDIVKALLSTPYTYVITLVLLIGFAVAAFIFNVLPQFVGIAGVSAGILGIAAFLAQDLESQSPPTGWPLWSTFIVIVVVGAIEAASGKFVASDTLTVAGVIGIVVFVAQWVINALNQDQGVNIPSSTEMAIVVVLGAVVTALVGISSSAALNVPLLQTGGTVTAVAAVGGYVFAREKLNARMRAARSPPA